MTNVLRTLLCLQAIGTLCAALAALVEIETIVASGPILSLSGLVIVAWGVRRDSVWAFYSGLSAPTMSVVCFCIIYGLQWSPAQAGAPIGALVTLYAVASVPVAIAAIRQLSSAVAVRPPARLQFSLRHVLGLMLLVSVNLMLLRTGSEMAVSAGVLYSYGFVCRYLMRQFHLGGGRGISLLEKSASVKLDSKKPVAAYSFVSQGK